MTHSVFSLSIFVQKITIKFWHFLRKKQQPFSATAEIHSVGQVLPVNSVVTSNTKHTACQCVLESGLATELLVKVRKLYAHSAVESGHVLS